VAAEASTRSSEIGELQWRIGHYRSLHARASEREAGLKQEGEKLRRIVGEQQERLTALLLENDKLRARQSWLEQQLFGRKSEQQTCDVENAESEKEIGTALSTTSLPGRKRGQQQGAKGHGRKRREDLPTDEIQIDLPAEKKSCPRCGQALKQFPWTEDCEEIHWEARLSRRLYRRARYLPTCKCGVLPGIVAAPLPPKLIAKGMFSTEFWTRLLLEKFLFQRPLYRVMQVLALEGLTVSQGTLTGGLQKIGALVTPLYAGILERNRAADHWHMDETRWLVFAETEGKTGHQWWLWVSVTADSCVYILDPSRSATVPQNHIGEAAKGILSADRYSAYKTLENVQIAFCWAHVRRDFLRVRDGYRRLQGWGQSWVESIDELFEINARRLELRSMPKAFAGEDKILRQSLAAMVDVRDRELADADLHEAQRKALESLRNHWKGLIIFADRPEIPMDNNEAERRLRNPIVGRKNYYGSGSIWSGSLSAMLFTIFQTLLMNQVDPKKFLLAYFQACAENAGRPPQDVAAWLPWKLTEQQKSSWRYPARPP
jgi:transposase